MRDARQRQGAAHDSADARGRPPVRPLYTMSYNCLLDSTVPTDSSGVYSTAAKTKNQEPLRTRARRLGGPCARLRRSEYYTYTCLRLPEPPSYAQAAGCTEGAEGTPLFSQALPAQGWKPIFLASREPGRRLLLLLFTAAGRTGSPSQLAEPV